MNPAYRITENTLHFAHAPVWLAEQSMLNIWVNPRYKYRDELDAARGVSGDDLARLRHDEAVAA